MYYRDRGACFEVCVWGAEGGGGQDSTGAIPRRQAGFYPVFFYYPLKKWGGHDPRPPVPRSLYFCMLRREFATRNLLRLCTRLI